jgi:hypothetical protein
LRKRRRENKNAKCEDEKFLHHKLTLNLGDGISRVKSLLILRDGRNSTLPP